MQQADFIGAFDLDTVLIELSVDLDIRVTRRMLAGACIGSDPEDAYLSARELRESLEWIHEGQEAGKGKLTTILETPCDDFQRCLYYCVAGKGVVTMLDDLVWLEKLLEARGRLAARLYRDKAAVKPLVNPYVASEPDGPVGRFDPAFRI
ncbi:hypothetical protein LTR94_027521, partial [Friedmanniomyces endolithicus]